MLELAIVQRIDGEEPRILLDVDLVTALHPLLSRFSRKKTLAALAQVESDLKQRTTTLT